MRTLWIIVKKDFLRLRMLLVLWWCVLILRALMPALDLMYTDHYFPQSYPLHANDVSNIGWVGLYSFGLRSVYFLLQGYVLMSLDIILLIFIVISIVQADSPIKPFAHWRTLPISSRKMLGAKTASFAVFCGLVPALINVGAKISYGFPPDKWLTGLAWFEWKIAAIVLPAAAMAALFRRPLLTFLVAVTFYSLGNLLYDLPEIWYVKMNDFGDYYQVSQFVSRFIVWPIVLLATSASVMVCMYRFRRRVLGLAVLAGGIGIAQCLQITWSVDFFLGLVVPPIPLPAPKSAPAFTLQYLPADNQIIADKFPHGEIDIPFNLTATDFRTNQPGEAWFPIAANLSLEWPDGKGESLNTFGDFNYYDGFNQMGFNLRDREAYPVNYANVLNRLGLGKMQADWRADNMNNVYTLSEVHPEVIHTELKAWWRDPGSSYTVPQDQVTKNGPGKLTGNIVFEVGQFKRIADIPAVAGAHFARAQDYYGIEKVDLVQNGVQQTPWLRDKNLSQKNQTPVVANVWLLAQSVDVAAAPPTLVQLAKSKSWNDVDTWTDANEIGSFAWNRINAKDESARFFVLWNPKKQEVRIARTLGLYNEDRYGQNEGAGLSYSTLVTLLFFQIFPPDDATKVSPADVQAWLADARLVELRYTPEHLYTLPVSLDNVVVRDVTATPTSNAPAP
ncbi:MAG TPA: hypothetical protein VK737_00495 [Opitutales bacterium]|nr:hypothetical protein [Opitutales bacterium]